MLTLSKNHFLVIPTNIVTEFGDLLTIFSSESSILCLKKEEFHSYNCHSYSGLTESEPAREKPL